MVEADSHLKLLSASIFDIYKLFEHIDMLSIGIRYHLYTVIHPTGSDFYWLRFWGSGLHLESKYCHYVMVEANSHLKLLSASILDIYKVFEHIDMLFIGIGIG